jgi:transporter family protein
MFEFMNSWQFNLIAYLVSNVIFFQCYKIAVKEAKHDGAATILLQFIAGFSILVLAPFFGFTLPQNPLIYGLLLLACIFYAISDRLQTTVRKHLEVSVFSILNQFLTVFLMIYGFTLFQEPFTITKVMGAILILLGNMFLLHKDGKFTLNKYTILSIAASFALATGISIDIGISENFNLPFYIMITLVIPALFIAGIERIKPSNVIKEFDLVNGKHYIAAGCAWSLSILFALRSFQLGEVSTVVPLQATAVLLNVIIASVLLKEHADIRKKVIAALLVISGVYITTLV